MFFNLDLNTIWYFLIGILLTGYAVLDGFDLGVGALHLFVQKDDDRRIFLNAIGPVWDGNEVWLVTGGGALFAAFPEVYASAFSGFYIPFMLLLVMLIFRAVAIEFRSKEPWPWWRQMWDVSFSISSIISSFLMGVALGNVAMGMPMTADHEVHSVLATLLNPYALLVGLTTVALFMMHASIYLVMKTENELHDRIRNWIKNTIAFFAICYVTTTMATLLYVPRMTEHIRHQPIFFVLALFNMLAIANIPREYYFGRDGRAFICSCLNVIFLMSLFGLGIFPYLLPSSIDPAFGLHIYNAASSHKTLQIMLVIAGLAIPLVTAYTLSVYWIFRGKVRMTSKSY